MWKVGDEPVPGYRLASLLGEGSNAQVWHAIGPGQTAAALKLINLSGKLGLKEYRGIQRVKEIRHAHLLTITAFWLLDERGAVFEDAELDDRAIHELDDWAHGREASAGDAVPPAARDAVPVRPRWPKTLVVAMLLADSNLLDLLKQYRKSGHKGIPVDELLDYFEDAAKGIDFLNSPRHDLGSGPVAVQHCDVKPQNIVLVGNSAMVCDFGLARVLGGGENQATFTGPAGTPAYVAPECIQGTLPSSATDQYSLAIAYFELRTGKLPFTGKSLTEIYEAHIEGRLQLGRLPAAEREVIRRATSLEPLRRYPSTLEMVHALRQAVSPASPAFAAGSALIAEDQRRESTVPPVLLPAAGERESTVSPVLLPAAPEEAHRTPPTDVPTASSVVFSGEEPSDNDLARDTDQVSESARDSKHDLNASAEARHLVKRGTVELERGNVDAAIADFDRAIDLAPDMADAYYGRAMAYGATSQYLRLHAATLDELAHTHFSQGDYRRAIDDFSEAIRINPELASAHRGRLLRNRALAYRIQGDCDKAIADYNEVIRLNRDFARVYHDRALAYRAKRDYDEAIADFANAILLVTGEGVTENAVTQDAPEDYVQNHAAAYRERGDSYYRKREYDLALADYHEAIRIRPEWAIVYNQRGRTYIAKGEHDKAIDDYTRSLEIPPSEQCEQFAHLYYYNRGNAYFKHEDCDKALADLSLAIEHKPDYGKAYRCRSRVYRELGMETEAEADWAKAESLS